MTEENTKATVIESFDKVLFNDSEHFKGLLVDLTKNDTFFGKSVDIDIEDIEDEQFKKSLLLLVILNLIDFLGDNDCFLPKTSVLLLVLVLGSILVFCFLLDSFNEIKPSSKSSID